MKKNTQYCARWGMLCALTGGLMSCVPSGRTPLAPVSEENLYDRWYFLHQVNDCLEDEMFDPSTLAYAHGKIVADFPTYAAQSQRLIVSMKAMTALRSMYRHMLDVHNPGNVAAVEQGLIAFILRRGLQDAEERTSDLYQAAFQDGYNNKRHNKHKKHEQEAIQRLKRWTARTQKTIHAMWDAVRKWAVQYERMHGRQHHLVEHLHWKGGEDSFWGLLTPPGTQKPDTTPMKKEAQ